MASAKTVPTAAAKWKNERWKRRRSVEEEASLKGGVAAVSRGLPIKTGRAALRRQRGNGSVRKENSAHRVSFGFQKRLALHT